MADITAKQLVDAFTNMTKKIYAVYEPKGPTWVITHIFNDEERAYKYLETAKSSASFVQEIEQQCSPTWF